MKNLFKFTGLILAASLIVFAFTTELRFRTNEAESDSIEQKENDGALQSFQFLNEMRVFPNRDIPDDGYYRAFEHSKLQNPELSASQSPTAWTSIGPNNIGGRSLCLAFSPTDTGTIYMGSASGGLWKSTTGGLGANAWTYVETGFPSLAASWLAIDSVNPNIMYLGTGENYGYQFSKNGVDVRVTRGMYGIGILKTTDGGATWTKSLDWSYNNQRGVWRVLINPKNHNTLYAATSEGVYKSVNAGSTWSQILNYQMVMDLKLNPVDTSTLFCSVGDLSNYVPNANVGIYKSGNAGSSWTKCTGLPAFWSGKATLEMYQSNPNIVYVSIGNDPNQSTNFLGLWMSTDAGVTWTQRYNNTNFMTNQGWYNNALLVKANDNNQILLGNLDVFRSVTGGTSFSQVSDWTGWVNGATPPGQPESGNSNFSHADQHYFAQNPKDPNKIYTITDGGLYRSNDFGTTFYSCNGGYVTTQFYNGFANSFTDSIFCIGGLQDNRAAFYQGTTAWYKTWGGDGFWCAVNSINPNICYTEYSYGQIGRSNNGGITFGGYIGAPGSGSEATSSFSAPYVLCRSNPNIMYAGTNAIYRSSVGGGSWAGPYGSFNGAKVLSIDCSATNTDTVYCGTIPVSGGANATVWKTTNATTWTDIGGGVLPNAYPTDIHVNPNNSRDVYVTFSGFGNPHVYRTSNGGTNWQNITGNLPDVPTQCVVIDPLYTQNIYIGNDLGVYFTSNNGINWYAYGNGMTYALVFDLSIVNTNRHIRATTHGHGIYERSLVQNPNAVTQTGSEVPSSYSLYQNFPNPFNPSTKIKFDVPAGIRSNSNVTLVVFDATGKAVATLVNEQLEPGAYEAEWNALNAASGVYYYRLTSAFFSETKKMILLK